MYHPAEIYDIGVNVLITVHNRILHYSIVLYRQFTMSEESNSSSKLAQIEQVVTAALRPLPTQTGDGSYVQEPTVTGLAKDLLHFDLNDAKTLAEVAKSAVTGEAVNDRDYTMERVIQVCVSTRNWLCTHSNSSTLYSLLLACLRHPATARS